MSKLSIIIPARNEEWLQKTIDDIFEHSEADTEILVGIDGNETWFNMFDSSRINWHFEPKPIGQRAIQNKLAELATGKYIMKLDAHCSLQQGFDRIMLESMEDNMVMTPILCRLDAENWQIIPKPFTKKYYFDTDMVFQYAGKEDDDKSHDKLVETMSLQGSCFMVSKEDYFKWNLCDEKYGSWGFQSAETACKTWFNGGRVVTNTDVFYGHLFRGKGQNVEEIPYTRTKEEIELAKSCAQELKDNPKMKWLVKKFSYPLDWKTLDNKNT